MYDVNANFTAENNLLRHKPVIIILLDSIATYFCTGPFADIDSDYKKFIQKVVTIGMEADPINGRTGFYGFDVTIVDKGNVFLGLMAANSMQNRLVTVKFGYAVLNQSDFIQFPRVRIKSIKINSEKNEFTILLRSVLSDLNKPIFGRLGSTVLTANESEADTTLNVNSTASFQTPSTPPWGGGTGANTYLMIDNELIEYTGSTANTFTATRGVSQSEKTTHSIGAGVYEVLVYPTWNYFYPVIELLTTTAAGTNGAWDLGIARFGMKINIAEIDYNQIRNELAQKIQRVVNDTLVFVNPWQETANIDVRSKGIGYGFAQMNLMRTRRPIRPRGVSACDDGMTWLMDNILAITPAYFIITKAGKLGVKRIDYFAQNEGIVDLNQHDIIGIPEVTEDASQLINEMEINSNSGGIKYFTTDVESQDESIAEYGETDPLVINTNNPVAVTATFKYKLNFFIFSVYGNPIYQIKFKALWKHHILQVGDIINLSHDKLINPRDNTVGWTREPMLITKIAPTYDRGGSDVTIEGLCSTMNTQVNILTAHVFTQDDINDYVLTEDADHDEATLQAADAYLDQSSYDATEVMVRIKLEQPGAGGGSDHEYIQLDIHVQDPADTDLTNRLIRMYYDETDDSIIYADYYLNDLTGASETPARIKIDWYAHSGANAPASVEVELIKFIDFTGSITES
jgi:hypothetical protein